VPNYNPSLVLAVDLGDGPRLCGRDSSASMHRLPSQRCEVRLGTTGDQSRWRNAPTWLGPKTARTRLLSPSAVCFGRDSQSRRWASVPAQYRSGPGCGSAQPAKGWLKQSGRQGIHWPLRVRQYRGEHQPESGL